MARRKSFGDNVNAITPEGEADFVVIQPADCVTGGEGSDRHYLAVKEDDFTSAKSAGDNYAVPLYLVKV